MAEGAFGNESAFHSRLRTPDQVRGRLCSNYSPLCIEVVLILRAPIPDLSLCPSRCTRRSIGLDGIVAQSEKRFSSPFSRKKITAGLSGRFRAKIGIVAV